MFQPQEVQTQSQSSAQSLPQQLQEQHQHPEHIQSPRLDQQAAARDHFQEDGRQGVPVIHINQGNSDNTSPYQQDMNIHQQLPIVHRPEPNHSTPLRRSDRATRGQTSRYDDFVQTIHPVYPPPHMPYYYQCPQMMTNQMMPNQMMTNQLMSNKMTTNQTMTNNLLQPTMLCYQ